MFRKDEDDLECPWRQVHYELLRESDEWDLFTQRWHEWARTREVHNAWVKSEFQRCTSVCTLTPRLGEGGGTGELELTLPWAPFGFVHPFPPQARPWWSHLLHDWLNEDENDRERRAALSPEWQAVGVCEPVAGEDEWFPMSVKRRSQIRRSLDRFAEVLQQLEKEGEFWSPEWDERKRAERRAKLGKVIDLSD